MILALLALLQAVPDTISAFDTPATRILVERVIREGAEIPLGLRDYRARVRSQLFLSFKADSGVVGELPITVDEFVGELRWERGGRLRHSLRGHRLRLAAPAPYTIGTAVENTWLIPHLYGPTINVLRTSFSIAPERDRGVRAIHPFSERGLQHYRYTTGDTVRIQTGTRTITLVPIRVAPRRATNDRTAVLVAGSFGIDLDRAAVARARFGFVEPTRGLRLIETGTYFELENALVQNRFWLPRWQRREVQGASLLAGGGAVARFVTTFDNWELNTGWTLAPDAPRIALIREIAPGDSAFRGWTAPIGSDAAEWDVADFADLRQATADFAGSAGNASALRVALRPARVDHLFRYNRVEGPFVGLSARAEPRDPALRNWSTYATGGWAFAEATARGEASARWHPQGSQRGMLSATLYRRLRDTQVFRPSVESDIVYTLPAAFGGSDTRDFYDAAGAELQSTLRRGAWTWRLGGRWEQQDSVQRNTTRYLFGEAGDFPLVAAAEPGRHAALEGEIRRARGGGALGIGNSFTSSLRGEVGFADFHFGRTIGLVSARRAFGPLTLGGRVDGGQIWGDAPPQYLFRFGGLEGLRGYEANAFAGSSAVLGRGRALLFLPGSDEPLARSGPLIIPPLRPALVASGDLGWTGMSGEMRDAVLRLGSRTTDGVRPVIGLGVSIFEDALTAEWVRPLRPLEGEDRGWRFRIGLAGWY